MTQATQLARDRSRARWRGSARPADLDAGALRRGGLGGGGDRHQGAAGRRSLGQRRSVRHHRRRSARWRSRRWRFAGSAQRPVPRDARLLRALVHRHRRLAGAVGVHDGEVRLAAEAVLLGADRPPPRLRHRLAAAPDLHRLLAAALGAWASVSARSSATSRGVALGWSKSLRLLGHADPQADRPGAGDRLDSRAPSTSSRPPSTRACSSSRSPRAFRSRS